MISLLDLYLLLIGTCGVSIISAKSLFVPGAEGESNAGQPQGDKLDFCTSTKSCVTLKKKQINNHRLCSMSQCNTGLFHHMSCLDLT